MTTYIQRKPTVDDALDLYYNMRAPDRLEVHAVHGCAPTVGEFWNVIDTCEEAHAVRTYSGAVVCIYGVNFDWNYGGVPWLVGTDLLDKHLRTLCKLTPPVIERWLVEYGRLENYTHKYNRRVLDWLCWLGFTLGKTVLLNGHPFIRFSRTRHV